MFENVTYDYYSDTLGRSVVPDTDTFDSFKLEQEAYVRTLTDFIIEEREENGLDKAVCMIIEEAYLADKAKTADGRVKTSVSLDGYSESYDITHVQNFSERRMYWLKLFCLMSVGIV